MSIGSKLSLIVFLWESLTVTRVLVRLDMHYSHGKLISMSNFVSIYPLPNDRNLIRISI